MDVTLCVDALEPQLGGIGRYTWELCRGLSGADEIGRLRFYGRKALIEDPALLLEKNWRPRRGGWPLRSWQSRRVTHALKSSVVHGPNYFLPAAAETGVITVHDLSVFRYPETHPAERVAAFERLFSDSLKRAAHVITDTETVKNELVESFAISPDRVTAVHLGVDRRFRPSISDVEVPALKKLGLESRGYGLCVSTFEPRKKITELLLAWRQLPSSIRARYPLVLAGGAGWNNDRILEEVERGRAEGWLKVLGFVDEDSLPAIYAGARLFLYPSTYEGFGLPPIEAMASGVPVVTSNRSCLPEVSGDAARYVDPDDISSFTAAIEECLTDDQWQSSAVEKGLVRARQFTWDRCVDDTVAVYKAASSLY